MVQVIAHRGARSLAPENTMAAAVAAFNAGAHMWETDIRMTSDGHPVLFHDNVLTRCTDVKIKYPLKTQLPVSGFTLKELLCLDAGSFFLETDPFDTLADGTLSVAAAEKFKGERIPTLEQALAYTRECNWKINLELKHSEKQKSGMDLADHVLQVIDRCAIAYSQVMISSFYYPWLDYLAEKCPQLQIQALAGDDDQDRLDFEDFRFGTYNLNADLVTEADIFLLKRRHKKINLFTVNDPVRFKKFADLGVDGIFTDYPQRFVTS